MEDIERSVRHERISQLIELEETASPDVIRALIAEERSGCSKDELRAKYAELELNEQCWVSLRLTEEERAELVAAAEAITENNENSVQARSAYRARYCRIRDDVVFRDKLSGMNESKAEAWREADALEKNGLAPQQIARELRARIGVSQDFMDAVAEATRLRLTGANERDIKAVLKPFLPPANQIKTNKISPPEKKPVPHKPIRRGFLLDAKKSMKNKEESRPSQVSDTKHFERSVAQALHLEPHSCRAALAGAIALYSAQSSENKKTMTGFAYALDDALTTAAASPDEVRLDAFLAAMARITIVPPYDGPPLQYSDLDFMLEMYKRRTSGEDNDQTLRQLVLAHVQTNGPAFLEHMAQAVKLLDGLQERIHSGLLNGSSSTAPSSSPDTHSLNKTDLQIDLRAHLYAYFSASHPTSE